ncbi:MAG: META domain-containing protein [Propioniciclava sp.]|uniref:META domain-containing protein n=1 Tax=Propioniciclava sp. TaxID=2038686 RepID=UPI0039E7114D
MFKKSVVALISAVTLAACVQAPPRITAEEQFGTPPPDAPFAGSVWGLVEVGGQALTASRASLEFSTDGRLDGFGGCNPFGGSYSLDGSTLSIGDDMVTGAAACAEESGTAAEKALLEALPRTHTFEVADGRLTLTASDGTTTRFVAIPQTLGGTSWTVSTLGTGTALTGVIEGTELTVAFTEEGKASGKAGCNGFGGDFTDVDGVLTVTELAGEAAACTEPEGIMEQETAFLNALGSPAFIHRDARGLTLRDVQEGSIVMQLVAKS